MIGDKVVYTICEADNGYYAQLASGKIIVGKTLKDVSEAANAAVTEEMTMNAGREPVQPQGWQKGLLDRWMPYPRDSSKMYSGGQQYPSIGQGYGHELLPGWDERFFKPDK